MALHDQLFLILLCLLALMPGRLLVDVMVFGGKDHCQPGRCMPVDHFVPLEAGGSWFVTGICSMWIPVPVPMVACVHELAPGWWSHPMFVNVIGGLHEALDWALGLGVWLFLAELESQWSCSQKAGLPFFQVCPDLVGTSGLVTAWRLVPLP